MKIFYILITSISLLFCAQTSFEYDPNIGRESYEKGQEAFNSKNYTEAFYYWSTSAELGNKRGQSSLGVLYSQGKGVKQNKGLSLMWFKKAAEQKHINAYVNLGTAYLTGSIVKKDYAESFKWYLLAAQAGNRDAQYNIGWFYSNDRGVKQDTSKAIYWHKKAAEQNDATSQYSLGFLYHYVDSVKDLDKAIKWYTLATDQGIKKAYLDLALLHRYSPKPFQDFNLAYKYYQLSPSTRSGFGEKSLKSFCAEHPKVCN